MNENIKIFREKIGKFAIVRFSYSIYLKVWNKITEVD